MECSLKDLCLYRLDRAVKVIGDIMGVEIMIL